MGAPGPYNWRGAIFKNKIRESLAEETEWMRSPVEDRLPNQPPGPEPATGYYAYLGIVLSVSFRVYPSLCTECCGSSKVIVIVIVNKTW